MSDQHRSDLDISPAGRRPAVGARRPFYRRRKSCPFSGPNAPKIDYKDVRLLSRFLSERGKIVPSRITAVSAKKQRELAHGHQARPLPGAAALRHQRLGAARGGRQRCRGRRSVEAVSGTRPRGPGLLSDPRLLAAARRGLRFRGRRRSGPSAACRSGTALFWLALLPAVRRRPGLRAGAAAVAAAAGGGAAGARRRSGLAALAFLALFGVPAALLLAAALRGGSVPLGLPLALLGLWPLAGAAAGGAVPGRGGERAGGGDARGGWKSRSPALGLPAPDGAGGRAGAGEGGGDRLLGRLALLGNGSRRGASCCGAALAGRAAAAGPGARCGCPAGTRCCRRWPRGCSWRCRRRRDAVPLSALLLLLVPLFLHGRGRGARAAAGPRGAACRCWRCSTCCCCCSCK